MKKEEALSSCKLNTKVSVLAYIQLWENRCYKDGIPDEADSRLESFGLVPSYRRICHAILKNDLTLKSLGFTQKKSIYYRILKQLNYVNNSKQLSLFDQITDPS